MKKSYFLATVKPGSVTTTERGVEVTALAFVEGKQTPVGGEAETHTPKKIRAYAAVTNEWLQSGEDVPLFESPHDLAPGGYDNANKIGFMRDFTTKKITKEDLPEGEDTYDDLIGKVGAFAKAEIVEDGAIARYNKGLIKKISVGLGNCGKGPQFFEASVVPWGAVRGAMLYGHPLMDESSEEESSKPAKESPAEMPKIHALTMSGAQQERDSFDVPGMDAVNMLIFSLRDVLASIKTTSEAELLGRDRSQLMTEAISDFATEMRAALNLSALPSIPTGDNFMFDYAQPLPTVLEELQKPAAEGEVTALAQAVGLTAQQFTACLTPGDAQNVGHYALAVGAISEKMSAPTTAPAEYEQRFAAMQKTVDAATARAEKVEAQLFALQANNKLSDRYLALRKKAAGLNQDGKLSAAKFRAFFPEDEALSAAVARFSLSPEQRTEAGEDAPLTLDQIEAQLMFAADLEPQVKLGSVIGDEPIEQGGLEGAALEQTKRFIRNNKRMTPEQKEEALASLSA